VSGHFGHFVVCYKHCGCGVHNGVRGIAFPFDASISWVGALARTFASSLLLNLPWRAIEREPGYDEAPDLPALSRCAAPLFTVRAVKHARCLRVRLPVMITLLRISMSTERAICLQELNAKQWARNTVNFKPRALGCLPRVHISGRIIYQTTLSFRWIVLPQLTLRLRAWQRH
jgi:hypothetical protein